MLRTALCDLFGIERLITQGDMGWLATSGLATALSEAGDPCIIDAGYAPPELIEQQITRTHELKPIYQIIQDITAESYVVINRLSAYQQGGN